MTEDLKPRFDQTASIGETIVPMSSAFSGLATGYVAIMDKTVTEPSTAPILPENMNTEIDRFWSAYALTIQTVEGHLERAASENPTEEEAHLFGTIRQMLRGTTSDKDIIERNEDELDSFYKKRIVGKIKGQNVSAATAMYKALWPFIQMQANSEDPTAKALSKELHEMLYTFLSHYDPDDQPAHIENLRADHVVFYETAGLGTIAELMNEQGLARVKGVWVDETTASSHAPITAKSMRLLLGWSDEGKRPSGIQNGQKVILDGINGTMILNPSPQRWAQAQKEEEKYEKGYSKLLKESKKQRNPNTRDDVEFKISQNIGLPEEALGVDEVNASSLGLIRTEQWVSRLPETQRANITVEQWYEYAETIINDSNRSHSAFRLPDFAGDKQLGGLTKDDMYVMNGRLMQALLKLNNDRPRKNIHLMAPLIDAGSQLTDLQSQIDHLADNIDVKSIKLGSMAESPAFLDELEAHRIDAKFISVGSNDMNAATQALSRFDQNDQDRVDLTSLSVLKNLHRPIVFRDENGGPTQIPVSICGDMAGQPRYFALLTGMSYTRLSVPKALVPVIKELVRRIDTQEAKILFENINKEPSRQAREDMLDQFNEEKLGLRRNGTIDMNWKHPDDMKAENEPAKPSLEG